jgi:hypothetical protein
MVLADAMQGEATRSGWLLKDVEVIGVKNVMKPPMIGVVAKSGVTATTSTVGLKPPMI